MTLSAIKITNYYHAPCVLQMEESIYIESLAFCPGCQTHFELEEILKFPEKFPTREQLFDKKLTDVLS